MEPYNRVIDLKKAYFNFKHSKPHELFRPAPHIKFKIQSIQRQPTQKNWSILRKKPPTSYILTYNNPNIFFPIYKAHRKRGPTGPLAFVPLANTPFFQHFLVILVNIGHRKCIPILLRPRLQTETETIPSKSRLHVETRILRPFLGYKLEVSTRKGDLFDSYLYKLYGGQTRSENATRGATICECGPSLENIRVSSASVDVHSDGNVKCIKLPFVLWNDLFFVNLRFLWDNFDGCVLVLYCYCYILIGGNLIVSVLSFVVSVFLFDVIIDDLYVACYRNWLSLSNVSIFFDRRSWVINN